MTELARWDGFYVIAGSAAGALIGLQFVVLTLIAERPPEGAAEGGAAFGSPTVVHFSAVLVLSLLFHAPWGMILWPAILWGAIGAGGVVYVGIVLGRMRRHPAYRPIFEDWFFHGIVPFTAYAMLLVSSFLAVSRTREALFAVAAANVLLLLASIHNTWDNVAYTVLVHMAGAKSDRNQTQD
jgi:hypothetical protein